MDMTAELTKRTEQIENIIKKGTSRGFESTFFMG